MSNFIPSYNNGETETTQTASAAKIQSPREAHDIVWETLGRAKLGIKTSNGKRYTIIDLFKKSRIDGDMSLSLVQTQDDYENSQNYLGYLCNFDISFSQDSEGLHLSYPNGETVDFVERFGNFLDTYGYGLELYLNATFQGTSGLVEIKSSNGDRMYFLDGKLWKTVAKNGYTTSVSHSLNALGDIETITADDSVTTMSYVRNTVFNYPVSVTLNEEEPVLFSQTQSGAQLVLSFSLNGQPMQLGYSSGKQIFIYDDSIKAKASLDYSLYASGDKKITLSHYAREVVSGSEQDYLTYQQEVTFYVNGGSDVYSTVKYKEDDRTLIQYDYTYLNTSKEIVTSIAQSSPFSATPAQTIYPDADMPLKSVAFSATSQTLPRATDFDASANVRFQANCVQSLPSTLSMTLWISH